MTNLFLIFFSFLVLLFSNIVDTFWSEFNLIIPNISKPLVYEKDYYTLTFNNLANSNNPIVSTQKKYNTNNSIGLSFPANNISPFSFCGDNTDTPIVFNVFAHPYNQDKSPDVNAYSDLMNLIYSSTLNKVTLGKNEYIHLKEKENERRLSSRDYILFASSTIVELTFNTEICGGKYDLSNNQIKNILKGVSVVSKDVKSDDMSYAYKDFINNKIDGVINTPSDCFNYSKKKNGTLDKICRDFTDLMSYNVISNISGEGRYYHIKDEKSCRKFVSTLSKAEEDAAISTFNYKNSLSICSDSRYWSK